ncbi:hypothetical protein OSTOST_06575 [Ostertagia ostertagi]
MIPSVAASLLLLMLGSFVNAQNFGNFGQSSLMGAGSYPGLGFGGMSNLGLLGGAGTSFPAFGMGSLGGFGPGAMPSFGGFGAGGMGLGPYSMMGSNFAGFR